MLLVHHQSISLTSGDNTYTNSHREWPTGSRNSMVPSGSNRTALVYEEDKPKHNNCVHRSNDEPQNPANLSSEDSEQCEAKRSLAKSPS